MAYKVTIKSISTDGTNLFVEANVFDGSHTLPPITPSFSVETSASEIDTYFQAIADAAPSLSGAMQELVGKTYTQA